MEYSNLTEQKLILPKEQNPFLIILDNFHSVDDNLLNLLNSLLDVDAMLNPVYFTSLNKEDEFLYKFFTLCSSSYFNNNVKLEKLFNKFSKITLPELNINRIFNYTIPEVVVDQDFNDTETEKQRTTLLEKILRSSKVGDKLKLLFLDKVDQEKLATLPLGLISINLLNNKHTSSIEYLIEHKFITINKNIVNQNKDTKLIHYAKTFSQIEILLDLNADITIPVMNNNDENLDIKRLSVHSCSHPLELLLNRIDKDYSDFSKSSINNRKNTKKELIKLLSNEKLTNNLINTDKTLVNSKTLLNLIKSLHFYPEVSMSILRNKHYKKLFDSDILDISGEHIISSFIDKKNYNLLEFLEKRKLINPIEIINSNKNKTNLPKTIISILSYINKKLTTNEILYRKNLFTQLMHNPNLEKKDENNNNIAHQIILEFKDLMSTHLDINMNYSLKRDNNKIGLDYIFTLKEQDESDYGFNVPNTLLKWVNLSNIDFFEPNNDGITPASMLFFTLKNEKLKDLFINGDHYNTLLDDIPKSWPGYKNLNNEQKNILIDGVIKLIIFTDLPSEYSNFEELNKKGYVIKDKYFFKTMVKHFTEIIYKEEKFSNNFINHPNMTPFIKYLNTNYSNEATILKINIEKQLLENKLSENFNIKEKEEEENIPKRRIKI